MPKLLINQQFPGLLTRRDYALLTVVDGDGRVSTKKINPGKEHRDWFMPEWGHDQETKRINLLHSVSLTSMREAAGCTFLQQDYEAEGWLDGWKAYQSYLDHQFYVEVRDRSGNMVKQRRNKPLDVAPFPDHLLPKSVLERRARAKKEVKAWVPPEIQRPKEEPEPKSKVK